MDSRDAGVLEERYQRLLREAWARAEAVEGRLMTTAASLEEMTNERDCLRVELARRQPRVEP
jgi:hypothetical protein